MHKAGELMWHQSQDRRGQIRLDGPTPGLCAHPLLTRLAPWLVLLAVVASACGDGSSGSLGGGVSDSGGLASPVDVGASFAVADEATAEAIRALSDVSAAACSSGYRLHPVAELLAVDAWFAVDAAELRSVLEDASVDTVKGPLQELTDTQLRMARAALPVTSVAVSGIPVDGSWDLSWDHEAALAASSGEGQVLVGVTFLGGLSEERGTGSASVISRDASDGVLNARRCGNGLAAELSAYAAAAPEFTTPWQALEALIAPDNEAAVEAYRAWSDPEPVAWEDRPSDRRQVSWDETPEEVLSTLTFVPVEVTIGDGWTKLPGGLCTATSVGLNLCTSFDADPEEGGIPLDTWVVPGEPLNIVAIGASGDYDSIQTLMVIDEPALLADFDGTHQITIELHGTVNSLDDAIQHAANRNLITITTGATTTP